MLLLGYFFMKNEGWGQFDHSQKKLPSKSSALLRLSYLPLGEKNMTKTIFDTVANFCQNTIG